MYAQSQETASRHWPTGIHVDCACPHCGHIDQHYIDRVREMGGDARDGQCSACHGEYMVAAKDGVVKGQKLAKDAETFRVAHRYDIGDQAVYVQSSSSLDLRQAAIYIQMKAEEWFGVETLVTNLGVVSALVTFYGCNHAAKNKFSESIDMHDDREVMCRAASDLLADVSLHRDGLRNIWLRTSMNKATESTCTSLHSMNSSPGCRSPGILLGGICRCESPWTWINRTTSRCRRIGWPASANFTSSPASVMRGCSFKSRRSVSALSDIGKDPHGFTAF